ncbi:MAG: hypothetical protein HW406_2026 [Candidatus Brocadiaceae bacterium]|nr:hypothetical protein [Candidatus Brocadiaceae bacterium]
MKDTHIALSIFIPVFNEEGIFRQNAERLIEFVNALSIPYEIVICSNGSTDRTVELGCALENAYPEKVRFFAINEKGVGRALKFCIPHFKYSYILSLDMDLSSDLSFIKEVLTHLTDYDIIIGSKKVGSQNRKFIRKLGSGLYIFLTKLLLGIKYTDYSLGSKVYRKDIIERYVEWINDYGTDYVINIVYNAFQDGHRIIEIPVKCFDNRASRFNLLGEGIYRFRKIFALRFKHKIKVCRNKSI